MTRWVGCGAKAAVLVGQEPTRNIHPARQAVQQTGPWACRCEEDMGHFRADLCEVDMGHPCSALGNRRLFKMVHAADRAQEIVQHRTQGARSLAMDDLDPGHP